jgi:hypothetical protein
MRSGERGGHAICLPLFHPSTWEIHVHTVTGNVSRTKSYIVHGPRALSEAACNIWSNSLMELSASWETAAIQELQNILWNQKIHYRVHKNTPLVPILSQVNPIHITNPIPLRSFLTLSTHLRLGVPSGCWYFFRHCYTRNLGTRHAVVTRTALNVAPDDMVLPFVTRILTCELSPRRWRQCDPRNYLAHTCASAIWSAYYVLKISVLPAICMASEGGSYQEFCGPSFVAPGLGMKVSSARTPSRIPPPPALASTAILLVPSHNSLLIRWSHTIFASKFTLNSNNLLKFCVPQHDLCFLLYSRHCIDRAVHIIKAIKASAR